MIIQGGIDPFHQGKCVTGAQFTETPNFCNGRRAKVEKPTKITNKEKFKANPRIVMQKDRQK